MHDSKQAVQHRSVFLAASLAGTVRLAVVFPRVVFADASLVVESVASAFPSVRSMMGVDVDACTIALTLRNT